MLGAEAELGEQRPGVARERARSRPRSGRGAAPSPANAARAWSSSPTTTPGPSQRVARVERRAARASASSSVVLPLPFGAEDRDPLAVVDLEVDRAEREVAPPHDRAREPGDDRAAAGRGRDLHAQVPAFPRLVDRVGLEPGERLVGDLGLGRDVLAAVAAEVADELVGLARLLHLGRALHRPLPLALGPVGERRRAATGNSSYASSAWRRAVARSSRYACQPPAYSVAVWVCSSSSSTHVIVRSRNARSCETMTAPPVSSSRRNRSSRSRPGEVEVVRGLVEQEHVEAGEQDRGEARARGLPARERGHLEIERRAPGGRGRRRPRRPGRRSRRRRARGSARARRRTCRRRPGAASASAADGGVERVLGVGHAGAPREVRAHRLAGAALRFLGEVARRSRVGGLRVTVPESGRVEAGEDLEQRRLAGAVRRDDADAVLRADRARHAVEHDARTERLGEVTGDEGGEEGHGDTCGRAANKAHRPEAGLGRHGSEGGRITTSATRIARACEHHPVEFRRRRAAAGPDARRRRRRRSGSASSTPATRARSFAQCRLVDVELVRCDLSGATSPRRCGTACTLVDCRGVVDRAPAGDAARRDVRRLQARRREPPARPAAARSLRRLRARRRPTSRAAASRT